MFYFYLLIAGGVGAILRYGVTQLSINLASKGVSFVPSHLLNNGFVTQYGALYGTLSVNILGSFLMGFASWSLVHKWQLPPTTQTLILTGLLGGFTTFSAFSLEVIKLIENDLFSRAIIYVLISVLLSVIMCFAGLYLAKNT